MPHYKSGYWVRVFLEAPNLEAALHAPVRLHCSNDVPEHEGALAGFVDGVSVEEVEVEHEHTSVFDDEGREIERYDADGKLIDPCNSSEEEGDSYVNAGLQQWMVELLTRQVMKGENRCQMSELRWVLRCPRSMHLRPRTAAGHEDCRCPGRLLCFGPASRRDIYGAHQWPAPLVAGNRGPARSDRASAAA